jgi:hypothetical protein
MQKIFLVVFLLLSGLSIQSAQAATGSVLQEWCTNANTGRYKDRPMCITYIAGVLDSVRWQHGNSGTKAASICFPPAAGIDQLAKVAVKYLADNPEGLHDNASKLTFKAWAAAYPCK